MITSQNVSSISSSATDALPTKPQAKPLQVFSVRAFLDLGIDLFILLLDILVG